MVKLVDTLASGASASDGVEVQVLFSVPFNNIKGVIFYIAYIAKTLVLANQLSRFICFNKTGLLKKAIFFIEAYI